MPVCFRKHGSCAEIPLNEGGEVPDGHRQLLACEALRLAASRRFGFVCGAGICVICVPVDYTSLKSALPRGGTLTLRRVAPEDDDFLLSVYDSTRAEELAQAQWAEGQREAFLKWQFDLQRAEYEARFPDAEYEVIMIDDQPAGRIWIGRNQEEIRLLDIALLPQFQNRGAGTILIKQLIEEARTTGKRLRHMVFVLNDDATRFYDRFGFAVIDDLGGYKHMEWKTEASEK